MEMKKDVMDLLIEYSNQENNNEDREQVYTVGTDNGFVFLPNITALNEQKEPITLNAYKSVAKIYLKGDADSYSELVGEAKDNLPHDGSPFDVSEAFKHCSR